ncbi:MAG TPA: glycosyltransferase family 2 protein, partial [Xanthobacteraceae bacterium]|nr:glycosyltransferase family 2 protein [Xanthobacteraceae bacterium]
MLSAIIITRNEAANVAACLQSVAFCNECIVVDSGSNDDTVKIAVAAGATVVTRAWAGFGTQKNFALSLARGDWVLSIDADERVSAPLAAEIVSTIGSASADGYEIARLSTFLGRPMRHSGWFPDYVLRLFRREKARFTDDLVHERVICKGPIGRLSGVLDHHPVLRLEDAIARVDSYSTAGAEMLAA